MEALEQKIEGLEGTQAAEAVKNLRLTLQYQWKKEVKDEEALEILNGTRAAGESEQLREAIVSGANDVGLLDRWGKSLLIYAAADPELRPYVEEAVDDARAASIKDFGLSSLIVLGVVIVLLKWRPKKVEVNKEGFKAEWVENDVSVISDLTNAVPRIGDSK